jgi:hypothetical protein
MITFTVEGMGPFPVDMLRYDACFPDRSDDAVELGGSMHPRASRRKRTVRLRSNLKQPTEGRWMSFGWTVRDVRSTR